MYVVQYLLLLLIKMQAGLTRLYEENNCPCISCIIQQVKGGGDLISRVSFAMESLANRLSYGKTLEQ
jgi:hypothetical protein